MVSRDNKRRFEGLEQAGGVVARQISPVDKLYDIKESYEGIYKVVKGRNPPKVRELLEGHIARAERRP